MFTVLLKGAGMDATAPESLTERQKDVLSFIIESVEREGYPPTIREIGDELGIKSTNGVNDHLKALEKKGYLERQTGKSRALRPLRHPDGTPTDEAQPDDQGIDTEDVHQVPEVGRIAAGSPIEAVENVDRHLHVGAGMLGQRDDIFALTVQGESMIEAGIHDGDTIFVRPEQTANTGDIVAVRMDGRATVKRWYPEDDRIRLEPENEAMDPIYIDASTGSNRLLGAVVAVFRRL
jgi:repressor LexA